MAGAELLARTAIALVLGSAAAGKLLADPALSYLPAPVYYGTCAVELLLAAGVARGWRRSCELVIGFAAVAVVVGLLAPPGRFCGCFGKLATLSRGLQLLAASLLGLIALTALAAQSRSRRTASG